MIRYVTSLVVVLFLLVACGDTSYEVPQSPEVGRTPKPAQVRDIPCEETATYCYRMVSISVPKNDDLVENEILKDGIEKVITNNTTDGWEFVAIYDIFDRVSWSQYAYSLPEEESLIFKKAR